MIFDQVLFITKNIYNIIIIITYIFIWLTALTTKYSREMLHKLPKKPATKSTAVPIARSNKSGFCSKQKLPAEQAKQAEGKIILQPTSKGLDNPPTNKQEP